MLLSTNNRLRGQNSSFSVAVVDLGLRLQVEAEGRLEGIAEVTRLLN